MTIAILIAVSGVFAFALLAEQPTGIRVGILIGSLVVGVVLGWFSAPGKEFAQYCKASYEELRRVVWPTRKETINTTGIVCAFVVVIAFFLFIVDKSPVCVYNLWFSTLYFVKVIGHHSR